MGKERRLRMSMSHVTGHSSLVCLFALATVVVFTLVGHAAELTPPKEFRVFDTPSDGGGGLTVIWAPSDYDGAEVKYQIILTGPGVATPPSTVGGEAQQSAEPTTKVLAEFPSNTRYVRDGKTPWWNRPAPRDFHRYDIRSGKGIELKNGTEYVVTVKALRGEERAAATMKAVPAPNWINWNQMNNLLLALVFGGVVFASIQVARRREIFLRRIPGLDAVDEAIGRATELGKPILYLTGAGDMGEPSTLAAAVILGRVGKRVAAYETDLLVPHRDPIVMAVCQEITKQAYLEAGKPDAFREDSNFFITSDQFSYTAAVDGIMLRRKPAANFFMGSYYAEALLLTETGASTGAIQIAGTDSDHQLPFFVTTCDYTLIGEELYAASAYLSREPVQVGTLRGQDLGKGFILGVLLVGTALATLGVLVGGDWPRLFLDVFRDLK